MRNLHLEKCRGIEIVLAYALLECYNSGKAYFLLRKDFKDSEEKSHIVDEAHRIVSLNTTKRRGGTAFKKEILFFVFGALLGAALAIVFAIIF